MATDPASDIILATWGLPKGTLPDKLPIPEDEYDPMNASYDEIKDAMKCGAHGDICCVTSTMLLMLDAWIRKFGVRQVQRLIRFRCNCTSTTTTTVIPTVIPTPTFASCDIPPANPTGGV
jgi:hypothetical protein